MADTSGSTPIIGAAVKRIGIGQDIIFVSSVHDIVPGISHSESAAATNSQSDLSPAAARRGNISAATSATRALFETLGSSWAAHSHQTSLARPVHSIFPASLVDATFAANGLLLQG